MSGDPFEKNAEHRWKVFNDSEQEGVVTQAVYSPRLERNIGFALLDVPWNQDGADLRVETPEGARGLTLTTLPFVDPDKKIPRAALP